MKEKEMEQETQKQVKVWKPNTKDRKPLFAGIVFLEIVIIVSIMLFWGKTYAIAIGFLIVVFTVLFHHLAQKHLMLEKAIYYLDRGEIFMIFANKSDKKLCDYLDGKTDPKKVDMTKSPYELLESIKGKRSVILYFDSISSVTHWNKKNKDYIYVSYKLMSTPYKNSSEYPLKKIYDNYDELLDVFRSRAKVLEVK